ncbi:MAG: DNA-binding regulatory protein, YebC/PmpR family [Parcubacteria group bacterium GW2011_GWA2_31_28]|nr:MAG: DNA-binding regulatory protein, YebC/PmpR family [Parcubacteria group bacterium GW2011_GWA2_31_28]
MSGHSKWSTIKHKKGAIDAKRAKEFAKLSQDIFVVAKNNPDINSNPTLKTIIEKARNANMPNENIERAITKAKGGGRIGEEFIIEAYGPNGEGIIIHCVTDNKNRTLPEVRHILNKNNAKDVPNGSVSWNFDGDNSKIKKTSGIGFDNLIKEIKEHQDVVKIATDTA